MFSFLNANWTTQRGLIPSRLKFMIKCGLCAKKTFKNDKKSSEKVFVIPEGALLTLSGSFCHMSGSWMLPKSPFALGAPFAERVNASRQRKAVNWLSILVPKNKVVSRSRYHKQFLAFCNWYTEIKYSN